MSEVSQKVSDFKEIVETLTSSEILMGLGHEVVEAVTENANNRLSELASRAEVAQYYQTATEESQANIKKRDDLLKLVRLGLLPVAVVESTQPLIEVPTDVLAWHLYTQTDGSPKAQVQESLAKPPAVRQQITSETTAPASLRDSQPEATKNKETSPRKQIEVHFDGRYVRVGDRGTKLRIDHGLRESNRLETSQQRITLLRAYLELTQNVEGVEISASQLYEQAFKRPTEGPNDFAIVNKFRHWAKGKLSYRRGPVVGHNQKIARAAKYGQYREGLIFTVGEWQDLNITAIDEFSDSDEIDSQEEEEDVQIEVLTTDQILSLKDAQMIVGWFNIYGHILERYGLLKVGGETVRNLNQAVASLADSDEIVVSRTGTDIKDLRAVSLGKLLNLVSDEQLLEEFIEIVGYDDPRTDIIISVLDLNDPEARASFKKAMDKAVSALRYDIINPPKRSGTQEITNLRRIIISGNGDFIEVPAGQYIEDKLSQAVQRHISDEPEDIEPDETVVIPRTSSKPKKKAPTASKAESKREELEAKVSALTIETLQALVNNFGVNSLDKPIGWPALAKAFALPGNSLRKLIEENIIKVNRATRNDGGLMLIPDQVVLIVLSRHPDFKPRINDARFRSAIIKSIRKTESRFREALERSN